MLGKEEVTLARDQLRMIDEDIANTDKVLALARSTLEKYGAKREHQAQCRRIYSTLLSPLRSLPAEILGQIFVHAHSHSISARWTVSHVCRWWRQAAVDTSELWTSIVIPQRMTNRLSLEWGGISQYKDTCLQRAKSRPTKWYFRQPQFEDSDRGHDERIHFDTAVSVMVGRGVCSHVSFETDEDEPHPIFFERVLSELIKSSATTLKELFTATPFVPSNILSDLASFSQLSKLTLSRMNYSDTTLLNTPWLHLHDLSIVVQYINERVLTRVLHSTPNLETLSLDIVAYNSAEPAAQETARRSVALSKLTSFYIHSTNRLVFERIGHIISTPSLRDCTISSDKYDSGHIGLEPLLSGCRNSLRRLWVSGVGGPDIRACLSNLHKLEELTMHMDEDLEPLEDLVVEDGQAYFPNLKTLRIICTAGDEFQRRFLQVIESRGWDVNGSLGSMVVPLQHAHLQSYLHQATQNVWKPEHPKAQQLRNRGLDLIMQMTIPDADRPSFLV